MGKTRSDSPGGPLRQPPERNGHFFQGAGKRCVLTQCSRWRREQILLGVSRPDGFPGSKPSGSVAGCMKVFDAQRVLAPKTL